MDKVIRTDKAMILTESSSFSGKTIAISYLPVAIVAIMPDIAMKIAKTPKSSGEYNLVSTGEAATIITWAIAVPTVSVSTFRLNSDLNIPFLSRKSKI